MASKSSLAIRQAQATEAIGQALTSLNERVAQIEQRLGAPVEALTLIESEPMATAAQVAGLRDLLNGMDKHVAALAGSLTSLAEQMSRIEAKLDSRPAQSHQQAKR